MIATICERATDSAPTGRDGTRVGGGSRRPGLIRATSDIADNRLRRRSLSVSPCRCYGNGGRNVWRVQLDEAGNAPALKTSVKVQEARQGSKSERISLAECLERWVPFLNDGGVLIDQAYQPQSSEGMVRCYVCGHRVVGFGHNLITALMTPTAIDTTSSTPQPMGRAMFGPEVTRFAALRKAMEDRWIPEMQRLLSIVDHDLPLLWDADFLFRPGEAISDGSYALCEINASSVAPFPPSAVQPVAAAAIGRALAIRLTKETSNPH